VRGFQERSKISVRIQGSKGAPQFQNEGPRETGRAEIRRGEEEGFGWKKDGNHTKLRPHPLPCIGLAGTS